MKRMRALGVGRIVVLDMPSDWFLELVDDTVVWDPVTPIVGNPQEDERILSLQKYCADKHIVFDAVWTIADKSVVLTAQIAAFFGKPGMDPAMIADLKNKQILREWLYDHRDVLNRSVDHVVALPRIDPEHVTHDDFPLIIKGKESAGKSLIHIVHSPDELQEKIDFYGLDMLTIEPYFEGTDIDLNVLVQNGQIQWSGFVENLPAIQPWFLEDGSVCHHTITEEQQKEILRYMQHILELSGIQTACLHVEFRLDSTHDDFSFTLIEINFRMGGVENFSFHLGRDNHDLIRSNLELAFDMPLSQAHIPLGSGIYPYMQNGNFYSHKAGILTSITPPQIHPNIIEYLFYNPPEMACSYPPGPNDDIGWVVAVSRDSVSEMKQALEKAMMEVVIDIQ
jgi:hypothetical protein